MGPKKSERVFWRDAEVRKLIAVFSRKEIQNQLDGTTRNRKAFEKISSVLNAIGYNRTPAQCREKLKSLKKDYRKRKPGQYNALLDKVMGCYPVTLHPTTTRDDTDDTDMTDAVDVKLEEMSEEEELALGSEEEFWDDGSDRSWMSAGPDDPIDESSATDPDYEVSQKNRQLGKMGHWSPQETMQLLRLVGERDTQAALSKMVHTRFIWDGIASRMDTKRSAEHCHDRWVYLKRRYREKPKTTRGEKWISCYYYNALNDILAKRTPGSAKPTRASATSPATSTSAVSNSDIPPSSTAKSHPPGISTPRFPDVPESDDDDEDEEDEDNQETEDDHMDDLFAPNRVQDGEVDFEGEMSENDGNKTTDPALTSSSSFNPTPATKESRAHRRPGPSLQNPKQTRARPKAQAPPREDLSIAQAITDAMMRFIEHQQFHLSQQTDILQRYLKFERARMRWEMDMETQRMKWEEERDLREEERRKRQEEIEEKRVSDNREFMLQMAVILGNPGAAASSQGRSKNFSTEVPNSNPN